MSLTNAQNRVNSDTVRVKKLSVSRQPPGLPACSRPFPAPNPRAVLWTQTSSVRLGVEKRFAVKALTPPAFCKVLPFL